jgi:hypothetical protein
MRFDLKKFYQWVDDNNMHILLTPGVKNSIVAKLYCDRYNGAYGWVTKELSSGPYDEISSAFHLVLKGERSGSCSLSGFGKNKKEAIYLLMHELLSLGSSNFDDPYEEIENDYNPRRGTRRIKIPGIEHFLS